VKTLFFLFLLLTTPGSRLYAQKDEVPYRRVVAALHLHSNISPNGRTSLQAIASLAGKRGIDALIPADTFLQRWEYGMPPLPGLLRATHYRKCVLKFGPEPYLSLLHKLQTDFPKLTGVPGLEVAPAYRWTGHPAKGNLTLHEPQRHILVLGLENPEDIRRLPVLSNPAVGDVRWKNLLLPALLVAAGVALMFRWPAGLIVVVFGLLWGVDQRPFRRPPEAYTAFSRNGYAAAQHLIDYVNARGGLTVWAHPEASNWQQPQKLYRSVLMQTEPYPESLLETRDYTGFGYFWEGEKIVGSPGGTWDQSLLEYALGKRENPVWAFGELDWSEEGRLGTRMDSVQNVLWVKDATKEAVLDCFRRGRFYCVLQQKGHSLVMSDWTVESGKRLGLAGETVEWIPDAKLRARVAVEEPEGSHTLYVTLVRNGKIWKQFRESKTWRAEIPLPPPAGAGRPDYYRLLVKEEGHSALAANPIFVN